MSDVPQARTASFRDILYVLFRHKWLILVVSVAVILSAGYYVRSSPDIFESNAKLLVTQATTSLPAGSNLDPIVPETQLLQSRGFAEGVVDRVGAGRILEDPPRSRSASILTAVTGSLRNIGVLPSAKSPGAAEPIDRRDAAVEVFMKRLGVGTEPKSNVVNLSYVAYSPQAAQRVLTQVVAVYMNRHLEIHSMSASVQLLADQTNELRARLERAKLALSNFQDTMNVTQSSDQQTLLLQRIEGLRSQIQNAEADYSAANAAVASTENKLGMRQMEQEQRIRLESLDARLGVLRRQLRVAESDLRSMMDAQRQLESLNEDVKNADIEYRTYQSSLERSRIARVLESEQIANVGILESPTFLADPVGGRKRSALVGAALAVLGVIGLAFLVERMNHTVRTPMDISTRIKVDIISSVPPVNVKFVRRKLRHEVRRRKRLADAQVVVPIELSRHVVTWMYFVDNFRGCFDELRNRIELVTAGSGKRPFVLAITSNYRHEGVSSISAGLAYSIAFAEEEQVLLLNSNRHHPQSDVVPSSLRPHGLFELELHRSLIEPPEMSPHLFGNDGVNGTSSEEAGITDTIESILPSVRRSDYKFVLMDLPSLYEGGWAAVRAGDADGTLLVIESEHVRREVVQMSAKRLEEAGAHLIGVVLNRRKFYIPHWLYRLS